MRVKQYENMYLAAQCQAFNNGLNIHTYNLLNNVFGAAEDISKTPGVSKLARSLFHSLPQQIPKEVVLFPKPGDGFLTDASISYKLENVRGEFHEIHKDFSTQIHPHLNIGVNQF